MKIIPILQMGKTENCVTEQRDHAVPLGGNEADQKWSLVTCLRKTKHGMRGNIQVAGLE